MGSKQNSYILKFIKNQDKMKKITILGIETSCDDTCISLIETDEGNYFKVLSNLISSQNKVHRKWGGIYPSLARREHQKNIVPLFKKTLSNSNLLIKEKSKIDPRIIEILEKEKILKKKAFCFFKKYKKVDIDFIALTCGPGLSPSLWTGVNFAKAISCQWNIPIIPVNHIEAHLIISLFSLENDLLVKNNLLFPAIGLIASGGHTQLMLINNVKKYKIIGETRDDAAGECFDKSARIIGLGYPGGPAISAMAEKSKTKASPLPRPMINSKDYDFSFSGLKTAVLYNHRKVKNKKSKEYLASISQEIQQSIIDVLISKTSSALKEYNAKSVILGGGVISNKELKKQLKESLKGVKLFFPPKGTQTDNALMIAVTGYLDMKNAQNYVNIKADPSLKI
jgi:N6-L-threonylcarbamoyladenine synthase